MEEKSSLVFICIGERAGVSHQFSFLILIADDLALPTEEIGQAPEVLSRREEEARSMGLHCNAKKT